jgi:hypothetical protein
VGKFPTIRRLIATLTVVVAYSASAHAGERLTLRNGFDICGDHHAEVDGRTRLYLSPGEDNYVEYRSDEIASVELVPDSPATRHSSSNGKSGANSIQTKLSPADLREMLSKAGHEHNLDVDLLASLVKAESGGNARALSPVGAQGLMQLMPATAKGLGVDDSFEPNANVRGGTAYLDAMLTRFHDNLSLALAAYNAGPEAVERYHGIPPYRETQTYVARVIHEFNRRVLAREAEARRATVSSR